MHMLTLFLALAPPAPTPGPDPDLHAASLRDHAASVNRKAAGVGIGYANGLHGQGFSQQIRLDIPFGRRAGRFLGVRIQGTFVHPVPRSPGYDPAVTAGLQLFGRGPVFLGLLRVYGGGGAFYGIRPNPTAEGRNWAIGGGGHFGIEAFAMPRMSFTFEVGGQAGGHRLGLDTGATVMGGMMVYLGDLGRR